MVLHVVFRFCQPCNFQSALLHMTCFSCATSLCVVVHTHTPLSSSYVFCPFLWCFLCRILRVRIVASEERIARYAICVCLAFRSPPSLCLFLVTSVLSPATFTVLSACLCAHQLTLCVLARALLWSSATWQTFERQSECRPCCFIVLNSEHSLLPSALLL